MAKTKKVKQAQAPLPADSLSLDTSAVLSRTNTDPMLLDPESAQMFAASVEAALSAKGIREALSEEMSQSMSTDHDYWPEQGSYMSRYKPYIVRDGVLQIPVMGALMSHFPYQVGRYATGYTYIEKAALRGESDPEVKKIALIVDSNGGHVKGCFPLVDKLKQVAKNKPVEAFVADSAYSAAYAIATAASKITVSGEGGTGSIGVIAMHISMKDQLTARGLKVTLVYRGKHKADGHPTQDLSPQAKERMDSRVEEAYSNFTAVVAENRNMSDKAVRATKSLTYSAQESVDNGLADAIGGLEESLALYANTDGKPEGDYAMDKTKKDQMFTQAELDSAVSKASTAAHSAGAAEATSRISTILGSEEAKGREKQAMHIALNMPELSAEKAVEFLGTFDAAKPAVDPDKKAAGTNFDKMMAAQSPNLSGTDSENENENGVAPEDDSASLIADYQQVVGA